MNQDLQLARELWWIDYLEDELEPNFKQDLSMLLHNSLPEQRRLEVLKRLRQLVKECEESVLPEDSSYYDGLHDRIMAAVDGRRPQPRVSRVLNRVSPRQLTPMLQKNSDETAVARFSRSFGGPGPHVFDFTCSSTTPHCCKIFRPKTLSLAPVGLWKAHVLRFLALPVVLLQAKPKTFRSCPTSGWPQKRPKPDWSVSPRNLLQQWGTGKVQNAPVLAAKARLKRFASNSFATLGLRLPVVLSSSSLTLLLSIVAWLTAGRDGASARCSEMSREPSPTTQTSTSKMNSLV